MDFLSDAESEKRLVMQTPRQSPQCGLPLSNT